MELPRSIEVCYRFSPIHFLHRLACLECVRCVWHRRHSVSHSIIFLQKMRIVWSIKFVNQTVFSLRSLVASRYIHPPHATLFVPTAFFRLLSPAAHKISSLSIQRLCVVHVSYLLFSSRRIEKFISDLHHRQLANYRRVLATPVRALPSLEDTHKNLWTLSVWC